MKKTLLLFLLVAFAGTASSSKDGAYTPVYMSRESLDNSVLYVSTVRPMVQTGKIYYCNSYIYVNECFNGVHIINNTDPTHPAYEGFIEAPGCIDMAVKGNIIYLDNAVDLVSFDLDSKQVTKRIQNVFPEPLPPSDFRIDKGGKRPKGSILVAWIKY